MSQAISPPTDPPDMGWHSQVYRMLQAAQQHGTTAQRPTTRLWIGRPYLDETLGRPIWVKSLNPAVWIDATGATV